LRFKGTRTKLVIHNGNHFTPGSLRFVEYTRWQIGAWYWSRSKTTSNTDSSYECYVLTNALIRREFSRRWLRKSAFKEVKTCLLRKEKAWHEILFYEKKKKRNEDVFIMAYLPIPGTFAPRKDR